MMRLVSLRFLLGFTLEHLFTFLQGDVVEITFAELLRRISSASSMSEVAAAQARFLDTIAHKCLVNDPPVLAALARVTDAAHLLAEIVHSPQALRINEKVRTQLMRMPSCSARAHL